MSKIGTPNYGRIIDRHVPFSRYWILIINVYSFHIVCISGY